MWALQLLGGNFLKHVVSVSTAWKDPTACSDDIDDLPSVSLLPHHPPPPNHPQRQLCSRT